MNEQMAANREKRMSSFALHGSDLFGEPTEKKHTSKLGDEFLIPPFSVLSAREGWWQERKRAWLGLGIQSELGRGEMAGGGADHERNDPEIEAHGGSGIYGSKATFSAMPGGGGPNSVMRGLAGIVKYAK